jgi:hypothetical protein
VVIEQFQPPAVREGEINDVEVAAIHSLQLLESKYAPIEIERFIDFFAVDGNVVDMSDDQFVLSLDQRKSGYFLSVQYLCL